MIDNGRDASPRRPGRDGGNRLIMIDNGRDASPRRPGRDWLDRNRHRANLVRMTYPSRHSLPHDMPLWVDPQKEVYFITINCRQRGLNLLTHPELAAALLDTVKLRNDRFIWFAHIFLLMPDHVHALLSFPPSRNTVHQTVTLWKRWTARQMGIEWQRDFFPTSPSFRRKLAGEGGLHSGQSGSQRTGGAGFAVAACLLAQSP